MDLMEQLSPQQLDLTIRDENLMSLSLLFMDYVQSALWDQSIIPKERINSVEYIYLLFQKVRWQ